jgi:hypothetical protein
LQQLGQEGLVLILDLFRLKGLYLVKVADDSL